MMVCQMRALARELWPEEFGGKPDLAIVKEPTPVKESPRQRPAIFALGPMEERRRRAAQG
jgi:hypothetical protein